MSAKAKISLASVQVVAEAQYPSLDLRGIVPLSEKDVPTVPIVYVDDSTVGGRYIRPSREECQVGQRFYDLRRGLILVSLLLRDEFHINGDHEADTLAHEWRHHWQYCNGYKSDSLGWPPPNVPDVYSQQIRAFFCQSYVEMDALMFAWRAIGKMEDYLQEAIWGNTF